ncbi:MAG TPA: class I SAM-dependent methyltransferase [Acidimicrobiia bacterium]|nr:class I SAM-dependent methyltransferase [Acidimicrobiia bacterium]
MTSTDPPAEPQVRCLLCSAALGPPVDGTRDCDAGHRWPIVAGILDCRGPLTGFDIGRDRALAEELYARTDETFGALLRHYWFATGLPSELTERYVRGDLIGEARAQEVVEQIRTSTGGALTTRSTVLEIGCGTAALSVALSPMAAWVVASDVSLAWLVLARRRFEDAGLTNWSVVAASADALPYSDDRFDVVVAADVIEHVPDPEAMISESVRVLRAGATMWLSTPNRFSLTPEPHVRVWGVGFVPRRWAPRYVRLIRRVPYENIRTLSLRELRSLHLGASASVRVQAPRIPEAVRAGYSKLARLLIAVYHGISRIPVLRKMLLFVTPLFHVTITKPYRGDDAATETA